MVGMAVFLSQREAAPCGLDSAPPDAAGRRRSTPPLVGGLGILSAALARNAARRQGKISVERRRRAATWPRLQVAHQERPRGVAVSPKGRRAPEPRLIRGDGRNEEGCVSDGHCGSVTPDSARRPAGARISTNGMAELICSLIVAMPAVFVAGRANDGARHCSSEREGYVEGDRSHPSGHSCRASGRSTCAGTVCGGQGGLGSARMLPGRVWPR